MRSNLITLALVVIVVSTTSAQKFTPGYYIPLYGDSIKKDLALKETKGYIQKLITPEGEYLAPGDIRGFGLNNIHYVVRNVGTDTLFLEVMNRGKMALYYRMDQNQKDHFYIENENGTQELTEKLNVLKENFPTCKDLFKAIDRTKLNRKDVQSIYERLYQCKYNEAAARVKKPEKPFITDIGAYGGVMSTEQSFVYLTKGTADAALLARMTFPKKSISPDFGFYLERKFNPRRTFGVRHELSYHHYSQTSDPWRPSQYATNIYVATVGATYLKYTLGVRQYLIPKSNIRPFISGGVIPMLALSQTHDLAETEPSGMTHRNIFKKVKKATVSYMLGAGVWYKDYALEFRYEPLKGFSDETQGTVKSFAVIFHYRIKTLRH